MDLPKIETKDQAVQWAEALLVDMLACRQMCDIHISQDKHTKVKDQQRNLWVFLTKQGTLVGALRALYAVGMLDERAYQEMNDRAMKALLPTIISV